MTEKLRLGSKESKQINKTDKNDIQRKRYSFILKLLPDTSGHSEAIVSNQKAESVSAEKG